MDSDWSHTNCTEEWKLPGTDVLCGCGLRSLRGSADSLHPEPCAANSQRAFRQQSRRSRCVVHSTAITTFPLQPALLPTKTKSGRNRWHKLLKGGEETVELPVEFRAEEPGRHTCDVVLRSQVGVRVGVVRVNTSATLVIDIELFDAGRCACRAGGVHRGSCGEAGRDRVHVARSSAARSERARCEFSCLKCWQK